MQACKMSTIRYKLMPDSLEDMKSRNKSAVTFVVCMNIILLVIMVMTIGQSHTKGAKQEAFLESQVKGPEECHVDNSSQFRMVLEARSPYRVAYVFSSYLDVRGNSSDPVTRSMVLLSRRGRRRMEIKCEGGVPGELREIQENHQNSFGAWMLTCKSPRHLDYRCPSISIGKLNSLPLYVPTRKHNSEIAVCVSPLHSIPSDPSALYRYFDLLLSLGASHFYLYIPISPHSGSFLRALRARYSQVTPLQWHTPTSDVWNWGQLLANNDCVYRAGVQGGYRYAFTSDLDEVLVPRSRSKGQYMTSVGKPWVRMAQQLEKAHGDCVGFTFSSTFFIPNNDKHIIDYANTEKVLDISKARSKVLVRTDRVLEMNIHHVGKGVSRDWNTACRVDPEVALVHHYRQCSSRFDPGLNCSRTVQDYTLVKWMDGLAKSGGGGGGGGLGLGLSENQADVRRGFEAEVDEEPDTEDPGEQQTPEDYDSLKGPPGFQPIGKLGGGLEETGGGELGRQESKPNSMLDTTEGDGDGEGEDRLRDNTISQDKQSSIY